MTVAPNPVLIHRSRLPFRYPRRSLLRWYGPAANTSASSASANFNITSRTLPRNASLNRSGPKRPSIWLKHCILFPIGVFLLGLTLPMSQILFWDTERIRLLYFPQQAGRRQRQSERMKIEPLDADCISFQTVVYVCFYLLSQRLIEQIGRYKTKQQDQRN